VPTLPPIPQESWDQHVDDQFNTSARADLDALDAGRQAQQQADQARVQQDAREDADFNASARADLEGLKIAQARNQEDAAFNQQARAEACDSVCRRSHDLILRTFFEARAYCRSRIFTGAGDGFIDQRQRSGA